VEVSRIFDLLQYSKEQYNLDVVLAHKRKGKWETFSIDQYINASNYVSYGLLALNIKKGDVIATVSNNRAEWNFIDMGMSQIGAVHLSIYPTISSEEYSYILKHAEPKILIVSDKSLYEKLKPIASEINSISIIYTINEVENANNWVEISDLGKKHEAEFQQELIDIKASIQPDDLCALTYTSGTTGLPKGVMISHYNYLSNAIATTKVHNTKPGSKALSFLPLSHVYERMMNYHFQHKGISIYYAESLATISDNLQEISPDLFTSVPRVLELTFNKILAKGKELPFLKKALFFWAVRVGYKYDTLQKGTLFYRAELAIARKLIFRQWINGLGGKLRIIVSGGACLQTKIARVFSAAGLNLLEGYGLTETSPVIAVANQITREIKLGTVGPILEGVQVKFAEDGEILCKGPNIMMGYYKQPELTAEVIDNEGWFHTGDIGVLEDNKFLRITDRKKEIFKLSNGKYVAPQAIENKLKESMFIEQALVIGENEKFASALISPNFSYLKSWGAHHKIQLNNNNDTIGNPVIIKRIQKEVNSINQRLGKTEQIKKFKLVADEWTPNSGELSPTLKLKRKVVFEKYKTLIDQIYACSSTADVE
jgi:long-chain acyl-CoA synthetase